MKAIGRRGVIRGILCAASVAAAGVTLVPEAVEAMTVANEGAPSKTDDGVSSEMDDLTREARAVGSRPHRGSRRRSHPSSASAHHKT
jgi:hypothetical protein